MYTATKQKSLEKSLSLESEINLFSLNWISEDLLSASRIQDTHGPELILPAGVEFRENCKYVFLFLFKKNKANDNFYYKLFYFDNVIY